MLKIDAIAHFGSPRLVAEALDISRAAVSKWPALVPEGSAYKLERITGGVLKVKPELYKAAKAARNASARGDAVA